MRAQQRCADDVILGVRLQLPARCRCLEHLDLDSVHLRPPFEGIVNQLELLLAVDSAARA
jgi:hypothetical protein